MKHIIQKLKKQIIFFLKQDKQLTNKIKKKADTQMKKKITKRKIISYRLSQSFV